MHLNGLGVYETARLFAFCESCRSKKIENVKRDVTFIGNFCWFVLEICTCSIPVLVSLKMNQAGTSMPLCEYCETMLRIVKTAKSYRFG